jgi:hypothetical protein
VEDGGGFKVFARGGGSGKDEDARANDGADSESGQRPGTKGFFQLVAGFGGLRNKPVDRLTGKKLIRQRIAPASRLTKSNRGDVCGMLQSDMITSKAATTYAKTIAQTVAVEIRW